MVAGALLLTAGCDTGAVDDDLALIFDFESVPTVVSGQVTDARTGAVIENAAVNVRFDGPDAARVVEVDGAPVAALTLTEQGLLSFGIDGPVPTESAPAEVVVNVSVEGYLETSERVTVASDEQTFEVKLVRLDAPPSGIVTALRTFTAPGGAPQSDVVVTTSPETQTGAQASLRIPAGTLIRDGDGTPLTGTLTASVTYFSNQDDAARAAFPGGFTGVSVGENEDGAPGRGTFLTAGFAAIEVRDADGREAEQFDGPIDISIDVSAGTENPETGQPIRDGDPVPVYSFDEDTGEWTFETRAAATVAAPSSTAAKSASGLPAVRFQTNHLTYWNLDYFYGDNCAVTQPIVFEDLLGGFYRWELERVSDGRVFRTGSLYDDRLQFYYAPRNLPMTIRLFSSSGSQVAAATLDDLCSGITIPASDISTPPAPRQVDVEGEVTITCPSGDVEIRPSGVTVWYQNTSDGLPWQRAVLRQGRITLRDLVDGDTYRFALRLRGQWLYQTARLDLDAAASTSIEGVRITRVDAETYRVEIEYEDTNEVIC
jgi:hypothetical protein